MSRSTRSRRSPRSNRVPGDSPVPFRWTVNPYRGCGHACVYCLDGATRVLLADGRTRPIAELRSATPCWAPQWTPPERAATCRPPVLAHWSTTKPAHRVTLADGTHPGGQRRAPLPDRPGVAARGARVVPGGAAPTAAPGRRAARSGCAARSPRPHPRPTGRATCTAWSGRTRQRRMRVRDGRIDQALPVGAARAGGAGAGAPLPRRRAADSVVRAPAAGSPEPPARAGASSGAGSSASALPGGTRPRSGMPSGLPERCRRAASARRGSPAASARPGRRLVRRVARWHGGRRGHHHRGRAPAEHGGRGAHWGGRRGAAPARVLLRRREGRGGRVRAPRREHAAASGGRRGSGTCGWRAAAGSSCGSSPSPTRRSAGCAAWPAPPVGGDPGLEVVDISPGGGAGPDVRHHHRHRRLRGRRAWSATTASPATPTPTSTSTPARTSTARSWSRSTSGGCSTASCARRVAAGARRDGHQHRSLPARRGPVPADAGDRRRAGRGRGTPFSILTKGTVLSRDLPLLRGGRGGRPGRAGRVDRPAGPGAAGPARARHAVARGPAGAGAPDHRRRAAVRGDGRAGPAAAHRLDRGARRAARPDRRGRRDRGDGARAAPAAGRAGVVPGLAGARASRAWSSRYARLYRRGAYVDPEYRRALAARVAPLLRRHGLTSEVAPLPGAGVRSPARQVPAGWIGCRDAPPRSGRAGGSSGDDARVAGRTGAPSS